MPTNFPGALDTFTNPQPSDQQTGPSHSSQHANVNDAIEAIETLVGVDAWTDYSAATSLRSWGGNANLGNGTIRARYRRIGKFVAFEWILTTGSTTTFGTGGGGITGLLPVAPSGSGTRSFSAAAIAVNGAFTMYSIIQTTPGGHHDIVGAGGAGIQGALATNTVMRIDAVYEAA